LLSHVAGITVKLQSSSLDILEAYINVENIKDLYRSIRCDISTSYAPIYNQAVRLAAQVGVEPIQPRSVGRQQHRHNAPFVSVQEYMLSTQLSNSFR
jgi:hypothetical protein